MTTTDQAILAQRSTHVDRPCPTWCPSIAGHPWESRTRDDRMSRFHEKLINQGDFASVIVFTEETAPALISGEVTGPSTFTPVSIRAYVDEDELTPEQASQLAVWLRQASITATQYGTATAPVVTR